MNGYLAMPMVTIIGYIIYGYSEFEHSYVGIDVNIFFQRTLKKMRTSIASEKATVFTWLQLTRNMKADGPLPTSVIQAN